MIFVNISVMYGKLIYLKINIQFCQESYFYDFFYIALYYFIFFSLLLHFSSMRFVSYCQFTCIINTNTIPNPKQIVFQQYYFCSGAQRFPFIYILALNLAIFLDLLKLACMVSLTLFSTSNVLLSLFTALLPSAFIIFAKLPSQQLVSITTLIHSETSIFTFCQHKRFETVNWMTFTCVLQFFRLFNFSNFRSVQLNQSRCQ